MKYSKTNLIRLLFKPVCAFLLLGPVQDAVANDCAYTNMFVCAPKGNNSTDTVINKTISLDGSNNVISGVNGDYLLLKDDLGQPIKLNMRLATPNLPGAYNQYNCSGGSQPCSNTAISTISLPNQVDFAITFDITVNPVALMGENGDSDVKLVLMTDKGEADGPLLVWEQHNDVDNKDEYKKRPFRIKPVSPSLNTKVLSYYESRADLGMNRVCFAGTKCKADSTLYFADQLNQDKGKDLYLALYIPRNRSSNSYASSGQPILELTQNMYTTRGGDAQVSHTAYAYVRASFYIPATCYINSTDNPLIDFGTVNPRGTSNTESLKNRTLDFATVCKGFKGTVEQQVRVSVIDKVDSGGNAGDGRATRAFIAKGLNDAGGQGLALVMNYNREYPNNVD